MVLNSLISSPPSGVLLWRSYEPSSLTNDTYSNPVSSAISRRAAASAFSPSSMWPLGNPQKSGPLRTSAISPREFVIIPPAASVFSIVLRGRELHPRPQGYAYRYDFRRFTRQLANEFVVWTIPSSHTKLFSVHLGACHLVSTPSS